MNCSRCSSSSYRKDGIVKGLQRYLCKVCNYRYRVVCKSTAKPLSTKRLALNMYLESLGFRAIGRVLGVNHVTIYRWIKNWQVNTDLPVKEDSVKVVELDEMHTYIGSKKNGIGYGLLLIDIEKGISILSVGTGLQARK